MASEKQKKEIQKSYFDVLGLCCSSEIPLIEKILQPLDGILTVTILVPSRTVIVVHDSLLISQLQIVKALNQARLEATVRAYGDGTMKRNWPSPYVIASGVLLALSFVGQHLYHPMHWLALGAVAAGLPPMILRSIASIRRLILDMNILMLIAVGGSIALRDYWEAGFIVFLFTISEWLESRASYKATAVMSSLMRMAPQKAVLAESGREVDARDVQVNTVIAVKAGELIPIDGIVVEGKTEVDESSLTGESFPVAKQPQSLVWAGTHIINGYISVKTTALAEHSAVAKMTKLVEEAQNSKSRTQRLIDSCAKYYTPAVVLISAAVAIVPASVRAHNLKHWFQLALVILVSACPCALVLSTPVATFCALTQAAKDGLLIKGGDYLEALARTRVLAFDKTGTLTRGEFSVRDFRFTNSEINMDTLLYWVSSIESKSSHPMASALIDYARTNLIKPRPENVSEFQVFPGEGVYGEIDGRSIYIGNQRIATRAKCETVPNLEEELKGVTVGYVFSGTLPVGIFSLSDTCRTGAAEAIKKLKLLGIKTAMLTGDSNAAASHVQNQLGNAIEMIHAELLPEDKVSIIKDLKDKEGPTAMIGDGMNDAPALASADVGISMGISGSAVATETSHVTLMSNDIRKIPEAIKLARKTRRKIIENIIVSAVTKLAILALAFSGHPLLWAAVLADVGTCLLVILNSMLLLQTSSRKAKKCCGSSHGQDKYKEGPNHGEDHHAGGKCGSNSASQRRCCSHTGSGCGAPKGPDDVHGNSPIRKTKKCCGSSQEPHRNKESFNHGEEHQAKGMCGSNCEKQDCHGSPMPTIHGPDHSHGCCSESSAQQNATTIHDHSITIHGGEGLEMNKGCCSHKNAEEVRCGSGHASCENQEGASDPSRLDSSCLDSHECKGRQLCWGEPGKRQNGGCCRSYTKECGKDTCCGGGLQQLPDIIIE